MNYAADVGRRNPAPHVPEESSLTQYDPTNERNPMIVYTVAMGKGGAGKTATAAELAAGLAAAGARVLAIDTDPQGNLSTRLGLDFDPGPTGTADVLLGAARLDEAAEPSPVVAGVEVLRGSADLLGVTLTEVPDLLVALKDELGEWSTRYDAAVIDTSTHQGPLTLAALAAADTIIATVAPSVEALDQCAQLRDTIASKIARRVNRGARIGYIVPCRVDRRRVLDRQVLDELDTLGVPVSPPVRDAVAVAESYASQMPASLYAPESPVVADYAAALAPLIAQYRTGTRVGE